MGLTEIEKQNETKKIVEEFTVQMKSIYQYEKELVYCSEHDMKEAYGFYQRKLQDTWYKVNRMIEEHPEEYIIFKLQS